MLPSQPNLQNSVPDRVQSPVLKFHAGWFVSSHAAPSVANERREMALNMSEAAPPGFTIKQERLSFVVDRITVKAQNNNEYPPPLQWFKPEEPELDTNGGDTPLDLTMKQKFTCNICKEEFSVQDRLTKHVASRHRQRSPDAPRAYQCSICLRRFARADMLTRHGRLHSGLRPYTCSVCQQGFSRSDHLTTHIRTHTGEKPYQCSLCPYAACRRDMITRHMRTHVRLENPA